jgi:signal transduction histidine kinase
MIRKLYILFVLFTSLISKAQSFDSDYKKYRDSIQTLSSYDTVTFFNIVDKLKSISKLSKSQTKRADVLHIIGTYYYFRQDFKKTNLYFDSAVAILKQNPDYKLQNLIELKRSFILMNNGEYEKAKKFYQEQEPILVKQNDSLALILLNMAKGQIYQDEQRHDESVKYFLKALQLSVDSKDKYYEATSRNNLGGEYHTIGNVTGANIEYLQALKIANEIQNKKLVASITSNIASIYIQQKKPDDALLMFQKNLQFYQNTNFFYEIAYTYFSMAYCYSEKKSFPLMKQHALKAIEILNTNNLPVEALNIYSQVVSLYVRNKFNPEAIALANQALDLSNKNNLPISDPGFYRNLSRLYEEMGNSEKALFFHKKYSNLKDSLTSINNIKQANELMYKYELSEQERKLIVKENENKLLRKQNELYVLNRNFLIVVTILIILIIIFTAFYFVQKRLKKQREEYAAQLIDDIDKERERIAMDLHDDLGLGITMVKHKVLSLDCMPEDKREEIRITLQNMLEQTRTISRELYPATLKHLKVEEYIEPLLKSIEEKTKVICSYEIDAIIDTYAIDFKMHIIRILQECIHNSLKYSKATAIRIEINYEKPKIQIIYYDNGIGLKESKQSNGLGFQNIYQRAKQIGGSVDINNNENGNGIKLVITLYDGY